MSHNNISGTPHLTWDAVYYGNHLSINKKNHFLSDLKSLYKETLNCALLDLLSTIIDKTIYILVRLKTYAALKRSDKLPLRVNTTEIQSQNGLTQKLKNKMCSTKHENMCLEITIRHENCEIKQYKKSYGQNLLWNTKSAL